MQPFPHESFRKQYHVDTYCTHTRSAGSDLQPRMPTCRLVNWIVIQLVGFAVNEIAMAVRSLTQAPASAAFPKPCLISQGAASRLEAAGQLACSDLHQAWQQRNLEV